MLRVLGVLVAAIGGLLALVFLALPAVGVLLGLQAMPVVVTPDEELHHQGGVVRLGQSSYRSVGALHHLHLAGTPEERGYAHGRLIGPLIAQGEGELLDTFTDLVPGFMVRHLLLGLVAWNGREMLPHFSDEELTELAGAGAAHGRYSDPYRSMSPGFTRAVQYHALHDISQYLIDNPLVNAPLVGCTAVAARGDAVSGSAAGGMVVGRLFDFEASPSFDDDKVVFTVDPASGHAFVHIAWAGLTGAVTGMNERGLWISVNAGVSDQQAFVGRPVIMAAREALQYAGTIDEALAIFAKAQLFVSSAILIASADEQRLVVAETSPNGMGVYEAAEGQQTLALTNHFRSEHWQGDQANVKRRAEGTSVQRLRRAEELLAERSRHDVESLMGILRDRKAPGGVDVGVGNRGAINGWIGAHLVVADLRARVLWVAEPRHGLGRAVAFDVNGPRPDLAEIPASADLALYEQVGGPLKPIFDQVRADLGQGAHEPAMAACRRLLTIDPNNWQAHYLLALGLEAVGEGAAAATHARAAVDLQPPYALERAAAQALVERLTADRP